MADFLTYVKRRKAELMKELQDLEVAERVFKLSHKMPPPETAAVHTPSSARPGLAKNDWSHAPKTIKEQVVEILTEGNLEGLTAQEILIKIRNHWTPSLERTSLSPQLSRLRKERKIYNRSGRWYLSLS